jgi:hypothetical protein
MQQRTEVHTHTYILLFGCTIHNITIKIQKNFLFFLVLMPLIYENNVHIERTIGGLRFLCQY